MPSSAAGSSRLLKGPLLPLAAALIGLILLISVLAGAQNSAPAIAAGSNPIPADLIPVFNEAARVYDVNPYLLAAVADQESGFGQGAGWRGMNKAGCCAGFMQIGVGGRAGDTWDERVTLPASPAVTLTVHDAYKLGQRPSGYSPSTLDHPNYNDAFDAVMAAAVILRNKVDGRPIPNLDDIARQAACGYYGACADATVDYADAVLDHALQWQGQGEAAAGPVGTNGYADPFPRNGQVFRNRIDMGVDYNAAPGTPIFAIGDATILGAAASGTGWFSPDNTQAGVYYRLDDGPYAGKTIYATEDIRPTVVTGEKVRAGQEIAIFLSSSGVLEIGWGSGTPYGALAARLGEGAPGTDPGAWSTGAGESFNRFLLALGAPSGETHPPPPSAPPQYVPAGYPYP